VGSNQYRTRVASGLADSTTDLMAQAGAVYPAALPDLPCHQVWGGTCTKTIQTPTWEHPASADLGCRNGQIAVIRGRMAKLPTSVLMDILTTNFDGHKLLNSKNCPPQLRQWAGENFWNLVSPPHDGGTWQQRMALANTILKADWCPHDLLEHIITGDQSVMFQYTNMVLRSGSCPRDLVQYLLDNGSGWVKSIKSMAVHQKCMTVEELQQLATSPDINIRIGVAYDRRIPVDTLHNLVRDADPQVRRAAISQGWRLPQHVLIGLLADETLVAGKAMRYIDIDSPGFIQAAATGHPRVRAAMAKRPDCPTQLLRVLSQDSQAVVRASVVTNARCTPEILSALSQDASKRVRQMVASIPACPPEDLERLAHDKDVSVRQMVTKNKNCPPEVLVQLSADDDPFTRRNAANHPNLPEEYKALHLVTR